MVASFSYSPVIALKHSCTHCTRTRSTRNNEGGEVLNGFYVDHKGRSPPCFNGSRCAVSHRPDRSGVFVDSAFRSTPRIVSPSPLVTRVLDHVQMSFADVRPPRVHASMPPCPRRGSSSRNTRVRARVHRGVCCVCAGGGSRCECRYVREDDDHTTTSASTSATRLFPWLP